MSEYRFGLKKLSEKSTVEVKLKSMFALKPKAEKKTCGEFWFSPSEFVINHTGSIPNNKAEIMGTPCGELALKEVLLLSSTPNIGSPAIQTYLYKYEYYDYYFIAIAVMDGANGALINMHVFVNNRDIVNKGKIVLDINWGVIGLESLTLVFSLIFEDEEKNTASLTLTLSFQSQGFPT